jgi:hypothetical protein
MRERIGGVSESEKRSGGVFLLDWKMIIIISMVAVSEGFI